MSSKCFVPNCKNTVGISFPKELEQRKKWLDNLKVKDVVPGPSSSLCLEHFEEVGASDTSKDAVPTPCSPKTSISDVETELEGICNIEEKKEHTRLEATCDKVDNDVDNTTSYETCERPSNSTEEPQECTEKKEENQGQVLSETPEETLDTGEADLDTKICRLCMREGCSTVNIFQEIIEEGVPVVVAILACISPIEISENDTLSKEICVNCLYSIKACFKFRSQCLLNDKKQRHVNEYSDSTDVASVQNKIVNQKRKTNDIAFPSTSKRQYLESTSDQKSNEDTYNDLECLGDFLVKKEPASDNQSQGISSPLLFLQEQTLKESHSDTDKKFNEVEEELRRVLEGQLTEEQAKAENIIIHVQNDEEDQTSNKVTTLSRLKLPIVIKPLDQKTKLNKEQPLKIISRRRLIEGDITAKNGTSNESSFSKSGNIAGKEPFKSETGIYEGVVVNYVFGTEFCLIDGYLYEYRLCKGNLRFLRCVLPACQATAIQNKIKSGIYSNELTVQKAHNHKQPDEAEKKKQMFYYVMKRKMQSDKTLNFRSVYDDVCKQDPKIKELVPLRNVINEICRHQLTYKTPTITSFEQFYSHIEEDAFQKLHFTHNGKQFYQEKFTAEDDSKAIVFANISIIEQVSYSNLMYVDASFKIDTNEAFKYQLVTVLVWIDESYYPILFALVSQKTQEIYKKIFEYLHDTLAPKLRPEEIVTDYEANLYYALGETYIDSSIGGSVFYYTQNLYKKICLLNLSRDLETNSYFRNIYHMLLMLPLLPVNTILDGLYNMEIQARDLGLTELTKEIFNHVHTEWIIKVTPDLFCVHRLENRINENVIAPFKKFRDFIMLSKGKLQKQSTNIITVMEKLIELEHFLQVTYSTPNKKKTFHRDLSSSQKKNVLKAWQFIESHPKININNFFSKVLGYIKCMENQLWIWGFYRYEGDVIDNLINAANFSIVSSDAEAAAQSGDYNQHDLEFVEGEEGGIEDENGQIVMEAVIDENGGFVLQNDENDEHTTNFENTFLKYV